MNANDITSTARLLKDINVIKNVCSLIDVHIYSKRRKAINYEPL